MSWKKLLGCAVLLAVLPGCAKEHSPVQNALDFRTALLEAGGCRFTAVINADCEGRLYSFSVDCLYTSDGDAALAVLQPEEIAGIRATVSENDSRIEFAGMELDFGPMADGHVSPMEACHVLGRSWMEAYIQSAGADGDLERITYLDGYEDEELTVDTWLNNDLQPVYAEIAWNGNRYLRLQLDDFQLEEPV